MAVDLNKQKNEKVSLAKKVNLTKKDNAPKNANPPKKVSLSKKVNLAKDRRVTSAGGFAAGGAAGGAAARGAASGGSAASRPESGGIRSNPTPVQESYSGAGNSGNKSKPILLGLLIPILAIALIAVLVSTFKNNGKRNIDGTESANSVSESDAVAQVSDSGSAGVVEKAGDSTVSDSATTDGNTAASDNTANDNAVADSGAALTESNESADNSDTSSQDAVAATKTDDTAIHDYEVIIADVTWEEAFQDCIKRGGYLCRINSEEENEKVKALLDEKNFRGVAYLGGLRDVDSEEYHWVDTDKEPFGDVLNSGTWNQYWLAGEPSFSDSLDGEEIKETYMSILYPLSKKDWLWNDVTNDVLSLSESYYSGRLAYICEFD